MPQIPENFSLVLTVERWLDRLGAMELDEIVEMLDGEGFDLGPDPEEFVYEELISTESALDVTLDERWFNIRTMVLDKTFTHRVTATECEHDVLALDPDLTLLHATESPEVARLVDGTPLSVVFATLDSEQLFQRGIPATAIAHTGSLLLPTGRLRALRARPGDTIGVRVTREGIDLTRLEPPTAGEVSTRFADQLHDAVVGLSNPEMLLSVLQTVSADDDGFFRQPLPPMTDLLEAAQVSSDGEWIAPAGFDFFSWREGTLLDSLITGDGLEPEEAALVVALDHLLDLLRVSQVGVSQVGVSQDQSEATPSSAQTTAVESAVQRVLDANPGLLMEPLVAESFHSRGLAFSDSAGAMIRLTDLLQGVVQRRQHPVLLWLKAKAYERTGQVLQAEELLKHIRRLDPTWPLAMVDLARFASDRGDAIGGLALLDQLDVEPIPGLRELLEHFRPQAGPIVGRNEPCWCGSGRKFKQCHLNRPAQRPLDERAAWLYQKAGLFVQEGVWHRAILRASSYLSAYADVEPSGDLRVTDAVMFEGGGFADFVRVRGELLPADERLLAEQWLLTDRSVYEIESTKSGESISVRDLRTGDRHVVRERTASRVLKKGSLICARVVPAGETMQIFGGIEPLSLQHRDAMMALLDESPSPEELMEFFGAKNAPPTLINTEGDSLVWCEAVLHSQQLSELTARLGQEFDHDEAAGTWTQGREVDGQTRVVAMISRVGDDLHASTNSDERMDDLLQLLNDWDPTLEIVSQERTPMPDLAQNTLAASAMAPQKSATSQDPPSPELLTALNEVVLSYERRWLDDSIPALNGLTPREAAADPTRREDLIALLESFPATGGGPGMMDKERLFEALGLPSGDQAPGDQASGDQA